MSGSGPTLWIDVDDLLHYLAHHSRPSGIQRVTFEICQALHGLDGGAGRVRFVRRGNAPHDVATVNWERLQANFRHIANPVAAAPLSVSGQQLGPHRPASGIRDAVMATLSAQAQVLRELAGIPVLVGTNAATALRRGSRTSTTATLPDATAALCDATPLQEVARPGDCLVVLGSPWVRRDYAQTVRWVRDKLRMRFALLIYDLIPLRRPEWCDRAVTSSFIDWHRSVLPLADQVFAISQATANDVTAWVGEIGLALDNEVRVIPMGTGLNEDTDALDTNPRPARSLPAPGSYALFVSTLEVRKNHALLFRIWRQLLSDLPRARVPTLVFAGRVGWLVADLLQQLENAAWLDGKIHLQRDPTDAELAALYRGCQFTLFPSLYEGWGLPISESLALGRPCIASNRTSLPEAGGDLARYFDPENFADAYGVVRAAIEDSADLQAWQARVAREFRHVSWEQGAAVIRDTVDALEAVA